MSEWGKKPSDTTNEKVTSLPESQKRIREVGESIIDFLLEEFFLGWFFCVLNGVHVLCSLEHFHTYN